MINQFEFGCWNLPKVSRQQHESIEISSGCLCKHDCGIDACGCRDSVGDASEWSGEDVF